MNIKKCFLNIFLIVLLTACKTENEENKIEEFKVISPIIMDTTYYSEYVADIYASLNIEIRTKIRGFIESVHVDEGQKVYKGQLLFSINNNGYRQDWKKAQALAQSALAEMRLSEIKLKNTEDLFNKQVVSEAELKISREDHEIMKAKYAEAAAEEEKALYHLSYTQIKAPFDGFINRIPNKKGSFIEEGNLLTSISNTDKMHAYFNLSENEYLDYFKSLQYGKPQVVSLILANHTLYNYKGIVETTDSEFNKNTGTIAFRASFQNPDNILKHGSSGKIRISNILKDALIIPQKSTFDTQEHTYVYLVDKNNKIILKKITVLLRMPDIYVIKPGLTAEDKIVFDGVQLLKPGQKIKPLAYNLKDIINNSNQLR